ncbi:hypothetical protein P7K49_026660 [Saguinus oedipus]|uniref:Uncharacterized protein n=1 Tax=Saguinus oedipus TaxID=9490 RepID=A0ABQ9UEL7_SAGOE|nr:hypothetical protein P7K49_026660 [Saguinus oedipus]
MPVFTSMLPPCLNAAAQEVPVLEHLWTLTHSIGDPGSPEQLSKASMEPLLCATHEPQSPEPQRNKGLRWAKNHRTEGGEGSAVRHSITADEACPATHGISAPIPRFWNFPGFRSLKTLQCASAPALMVPPKD